ncbi:MAG: hypothetical protein HYZ88_03135 [Candidatus Omnitrophica bacterium]|nr:hypothetical protein [Candidatus Omnitrophota bacterium]
MAGTLPIWADEQSLDLQKAIVLGGSGNQGAAQTGMGLTAADGKLYLSGTDFAVGKSLLYCFSDPAGSSPLWTVRWPAAKSVGGNEESFASVAVTHEGIYCAGRSWAETTDNVGGKEQKAVLVKFPLNGATGSGPGGALWVAKPIFFPYTGIETFIGLAAVEENGVTYLYAAGRGQYNGSDNTAVAAKFDASGKLLWTKVLGKMEWNAWSQGDSVVAHNGFIYVAGYAHWQGLQSWLGLKNPIRPHAGLWKLSPSGNVVWFKESSQPILQDSRAGISVAALDHCLYVACSRAVGSDGVFTHDLLVLKYDENGNLLWSKEWGGVKDEIATGITVGKGQLAVVGTTTGWVGGGKDAFLVQMDPGSGEIRSVTYHGGAGEDLPHQVIASGDRLIVAGETGSSAEAGNTLGQMDVLLLTYGMKLKETALSVPIDIKPGSFPNSIQPESEGNIPVAILSDGVFNAPKLVDRNSLTFGHTGDEKSLQPGKVHPEDVNQDGLLDLVCHFESPKTGFQAGDLQGILKGKLLSGRLFIGSDSVRILEKKLKEPPKKELRRLPPPIEKVQPIPPPQKQVPGLGSPTSKDLRRMQEDQGVAY